MPITLPGLIGAITGGGASGSLAGMSVPQIALGLATGIMSWLPTVQVVTADTGFLGAGTGLLPFIIPPPTLVGAMLAGVASAGLTGVMAAPAATGLGNGLVLGLAQGLITTVHPSVGVGTGIAKLVFVPPIPFLLAGLASADLTGPSAPLVATAVGTALTTVFAAFTAPIPIVGAGSISPSAGAGTGKIL